MLILPFRPDASWRHPPVGTMAIMLALLLIHIAWGRGDPEALRPYLLDFQSVSPVQWLTSGLLHADWLHLIGNLVFLYVFGAIVEDFLGRWFVPAYLLLTIASGALEQTLFLLMHREGVALGASSAIYALIALAVLWAPRTQVSTLIWIIIFRAPQVVDIRVQWLAGGYIALQLLGIWLQGGEPSSEFLHACGVVVGLPFGLWCLHRRWIDTGGQDLLAPSHPRVQPAPGAQPSIAPWEEQMRRLATAVANDDPRLSLAAYEVLRREHPHRVPDAPTMERLMAMCEAGLDFHRAVAIGERALAYGAATDTLRLRLARIVGQHLGDDRGGLRHLDQVRMEALDGPGRASYMQLRARFEHRQSHTQRQRRALPVALLLLATIPARTAEDAFPTLEPAVDPAPLYDAAPGLDGPAPAPSQPALDPVELPTQTGRLTIGTGATIEIPDGFAYVTWKNLQGFLIVPAAAPHEDVPVGVLLADEQIEILTIDRTNVPSRAAWEMRSAQFLLWGGAIQVHWEEGWIDTSEGLTEPDQLLRDFQSHIDLMNRRRLFGPGLSVTVDAWTETPTFNPTTGILSWGFQGGMGAATAPGASMSGLALHSTHACHLGAHGTVHLVCDSTPADTEAGERLREVSQQIRWEPGRGFATEQPDGVGERTGGLRRLVLPRLVFGDPSNDPLVFRSRGLGLAWLLILLPAGLLGVIVWRRLRSAAPQRSTPVDGAPPRCQSCGSPAPTTGTRCVACGRSLVQS